MAIYQENEDLITIGAYQRGSNPNVDLAIALKPLVDQFLAQHAGEVCQWDQSIGLLLQLGTQAANAGNMGQGQGNVQPEQRTTQTTP